MPAIRPLLRLHGGGSIRHRRPRRVPSCGKFLPTMLVPGRLIGYTVPQTQRDGFHRTANLFEIDIWKAHSGDIPVVVGSVSTFGGPGALSGTS